MIDPRSTSPGSNMPVYDWLNTAKVDLDDTGHKMHTLRALGVPYSEADIAEAKATALAQGQLIVDELATGSIELAPDSEMAAMIAYLQRLGRGPQPTGVAATEVSQRIEPTATQREDG
jgi:cytochrome c oxidase cbb3-type subunit I/II